MRTILTASFLLALATAAQAQTPTGVLADPCAGLAPMPAAVTQYMAQAAKARAAKETPTPPPAATLAVYQAWQDQRLVQDFAGRCTYRDANAKLPPAAAGRVVFFGDSITQGWAAFDAGLFSDQSVNRGISGQTTSQMVVRFQDDVIALKPAVVHILAGTNDVAGNTGPVAQAWIEANVRTLVELAKAHGVKVVLGSILPAGRFTWRPELTPAPTIRALNANLRRYAEAEGLVYVDYHAAMATPDGALRPELTGDGVHPNAAGYAIMRPLADAAIRRAAAAR